MNTRLSPSFPRWCALLALAGWPVARAADEPPVARASLELKIDRQPIDRDAAERVSYAPIVKRTAGSVVFVYSTKKIRGRDLSPFFDDPILRRFFDIPEGARGGRLPDQTQRGLGSGVIVTADGYVLTNNHVVDGADDVKVSIGESSKRYDARVVGRDATTDVAVLKIDATGLSPATFGDSDQLQVGDVVLAIGAPFGLGQSVSRGIVSALGRGPGIEKLEDFVQTDAAINPGNSGGALLDSRGRLVGINTAILSGSGGFAGVGFAIPINLVRSVAEQIVRTGRVERGYLGIEPQDLNEDLVAMFKAERGALISEVLADSPAEKAGLKAGDVVTKIGTTEIRNGRHLSLTVSQLPPRTVVPVEFLRDGKTSTVDVELARRSEDADSAGLAPGAKDEGVLNGVGVDDVSPELRQQLGVPTRIRGVIVTSVDPDSPSARQGLREGDIILDLDGKPTRNTPEAVKLSEDIKGPKVTVRIWRGGRAHYLVIDESK
jgi:serine protease Do